jgi:diaminopimelate epimerase
MLAAGDTFRAAAIEQLQIWGARVGAPVIARPQGADAAGLAFDAIREAREQGADILLMDTAGRLQNRTELMAELEKVVRVMKKVDASAPHAVLLVPDAEAAPVAQVGAQIERHPAFPNKVNVGFLQVQGRGQARLRVWERGAGETLACGTGACAAVVAGIRLGQLDRRVDVQTHGGMLTIEWDGEGSAVRMTGPATTVFEGEVEVPDADATHPVNPEARALLDPP